MPAYNFQVHFRTPITNGQKTHTIRAPRKRRTKPGEILSLYTGMRTKSCDLIFRAPCVKVEEIEIDVIVGIGPRIRIDGLTLDESEREALARRDGFASLADMLAFWDGRLPFLGEIIHWDFRKAENGC